jgi:hypothetical protein
MKNGAPRFSLFIDNDKLDNPIDCEIQKPGVCDAIGVRLAYGPAEGSKDSVTLAFEISAPNRTFSLYDPNNHLNR